jgi:RNA polymerase sigma-70 factor (ECF subfamily)
VSSPPHAAEFLAAARRAWPSIEVDPGAFARHLASLGEGDRPPSLAHAGDLYLACACALGDPAGVRAFDPILRETVARAVRRLDPSPSFADDVAQELREKLLVARPANIGKYAGRATLRSWLTTSAVRTALNLRRRKDDAATARQPLGSSAKGVYPDAELEVLRARYRERFEDAVRAALESLPERDRALLRMHLAEGAGVDALAAALGVGRSTAHRWLAAARARLAEETRARLCAGLRITPSEYESLAALVRSDVDVSVVRLLGEP